MEKKLRYTLGEAQLPCKLETILGRELGLTRHQIRSAKFRENGICVNGHPSRISQTVKAGDQIEVLLETAKTGSHQLEAVPGPLDILYEDEDLVAVNKPAGLPVHPAHGHYRDTLANYLMYYFAQQGKAVCIRAVGRLDRDTSGIVIFAKNQVAAARLSEREAQGRAWGRFGMQEERNREEEAGRSGMQEERNREKEAGCSGMQEERNREEKAGRSGKPGAKMVQKEYLALAEGHLERKNGYIELPIRKRADCLNEMEVSEDGLWAGTHYRVLREFAGGSLVALTLESGRTHQIRVHMAAIGHPLLGDPVYNPDYYRNGGENQTSENSVGKSRLERAALHCAWVRIRQPFTGALVELEAPLPPDLQRQLGREKQEG